MRKEEGAPAWTAGPQHSNRSTHQANTPRARAHRITLTDVIGCTLLTLGVAAILVGLCGLLWLVA